MKISDNDYKILKYEEVDYNIYAIFEECGLLTGKSRKLKYPNCMNLICSFDIETTYLKDIEESFMYVWQFAISNELVIIGRTWKDFKKFIETLVTICEDLKARLIIFVHNLSYEFQYLRTVFTFNEDDVFLVKSRKPLTARYRDVIEFRCSYFLTNMSLSEFTNKMQVKHVKLNEDESFDYSEQRFPWTELTDEELSYCCHDVIGLNEAISVLINSDNDTLITLPHTSTGYVRRDARTAMRKVEKNYVPSILPNYHIYQMCREAFRGGNTHANRYYVGKILNNVYSADRSSSYPDVQINDKFPVSQFEEVGSTSIEHFEKLINKSKAIIVRIALFDIRLRDKYFGCPYIPIDKCRKLKDYVNDNGRVLRASYLEMTLTDIDFKIIEDEYVWNDIEILDLAYANYGELPQSLKDVIIRYYKNKTELKGVEGQEIFYTKEKNKLNSVYGMSAQNPVKQRILLKGLEYVTQNENEEDILYKTRSQQFLPYQWGVWTTAWARYRLEEGIRMAGDDFVYTDTDCVKSVAEINWRKYNAARIKASKSHGAYATDKKGVTHYMGVYETEGKVDRFITWGAKKYVGEVDGKLKVTVSGVTRKHSAAELAAAGGIESFKPGLRFIDAGGLEAKYNDHPIQCLILDEGVIELTSNTALRASTYLLGITNIYEELLFSLDIPADLC